MIANATPLPVIAAVSRIVSAVVDRVTGDRADYPLLVAAATVEALKPFGIQASVMYGPAAWLEILEDQTPVWAGCWGEYFSFWAATQYGEVVDLNTSVAHRKRSHAQPELKARYSAPMLWSREVPSFYRYQPEGLAELEITDPKDLERWERVKREISERCRPELFPVSASEDQLEFANEPIVCPDRRILDDSRETFRHFDRALGVVGIPQAPF